MTLIRRIPKRWTFDRDGGFDLERMNVHIEEWAIYLGLAGWEIRFSTLPPSDDDDRGSTDIDCVHRRAVIRLDSNIPASQVDRVLVHELIHVLLADVTDTFNRTAAELAPETAKFLRGDLHRAEEWAIERLADIITGTKVEQWELVGRPDNNQPWISAFPVE